jgi:hypothetical protein
MSQMVQAVYVCVSNWIAEVKITQFLHLVRWQMGAIGYDHLSWSTAAWSPSRAAIVQVALRLFVVDARRDLVLQDRLGAQLVRRLRRAVQNTGLPMHSHDSVLQCVRRLAREYRLDRTVALAVRGGHDADQMRRILSAAIREDQDSDSEDSMDFE